MAHLRFNPWSDFDHLQQQMEKIFDTNTVSDRRVSFSPAVDILEAEESYLIDLDLPGVKGDSVTIEVNDGVLNVRGERGRRESNDGGYHRTERSFGAFERAFRLPKNIDTDAIAARSVDGVLTITLPKKPEAQPRRIEVSVEA